jgi:hypothetical protein
MEAMGADVNSSNSLLASSLLPAMEKPDGMKNKNWKFEMEICLIHEELWGCQGDGD